MFVRDAEHFSHKFHPVNGHLLGINFNFIVINTNLKSVFRVSFHFIRAIFQSINAAGLVESSLLLIVIQCYRISQLISIWWSDSVSFGTAFVKRSQLCNALKTLGTRSTQLKNVYRNMSLTCLLVTWTESVKIRQIVFTFDKKIRQFLVQ